MFTSWKSWWQTSNRWKSKKQNEKKTDNESRKNSKAEIRLKVTVERELVARAAEGECGKFYLPLAS